MTAATRALAAALWLLAVPSVAPLDSPAAGRPATDAASFGAVADEDLCSDDPTGPSAVTRSWIQPSAPDLRFTVHTHCAGSGPEVVLPANDCPSQAWRRFNFKWWIPFAVLFNGSGSRLTEEELATSYNGAGNLWDGWTRSDIFAQATSGGNGSMAGRFDGVSQIGWRAMNLRALATTSFVHINNLQFAIESDQWYNLRLNWTVQGDETKYDLPSVAAHEFGHSFGLDHPENVEPNRCLTMHPGITLGSTYARSPGDGDIRGLLAIYGP